MTRVPRAILWGAIGLAVGALLGLASPYARSVGAGVRAERAERQVRADTWEKAKARSKQAAMIFSLVGAAAGALHTPQRNRRRDPE
jgi:hypothetical protein